MKINLESVETDLEIETDVCIIGGGVAGQTLASELVKSKLKVSMVESGGEDFRRDTQSLTPVSYTHLTLPTIPLV